MSIGSITLGPLYWFTQKLSHLKSQLLQIFVPDPESGSCRPDLVKQMLRSLQQIQRTLGEYCPSARHPQLCLIHCESVLKPIYNYRIWLLKQRMDTRANLRKDETVGYPPDWLKRRHTKILFKKESEAPLYQLVLLHDVYNGSRNVVFTHEAAKEYKRTTNRYTFSDCACTPHYSFAYIDDILMNVLGGDATKKNLEGCSDPVQDGTVANLCSKLLSTAL